MQLDAVVAHGHRLEERRADRAAPVLVHAAVQLHIHAALARQLQHLQRLVLHADAVLIGEVGDDHPAAGDLRQLDGLLQRVQVGHGVHARVDGHRPAEALRQAAKRLHLLQRRAGGVARAEGDARRALAQRAAAQQLHDLDLLRRRRGEGIERARGLAQRAHAHQLRLMDGKAALVAQELPDAQRGKAAVAADAGGDAL